MESDTKMLNSAQELLYCVYFYTFVPNNLKADY